MSAVTHAPILKKNSTPTSRGFILTCTCPHLPRIETKNPDNLVRTICSNSYGQNGFNFYLCPPVPDGMFGRAPRKKICEHEL